MPWKRPENTTDSGKSILQLRKDVTYKTRARQNMFERFGRYTIHKQLETQIYWKVAIWTEKSWRNYSKFKNGGFHMRLKIGSTKKPWFKSHAMCHKFKEFPPAAWWKTHGFLPTRPRERWKTRWGEASSSDLRTSKSSNEMRSFREIHPKKRRFLAGKIIYIWWCPIVS